MYQEKITMIKFIIFLSFALVVIAGQDIQKSCLDEPHSGLCHGYFQMWFYDPEKQDCLKFVYGGCGGNGNRYRTKEECLTECKGVQKERSDEDICSLPAEAGLCEAYMPRYYFDKSTGVCKRFVYGGCGGNKNNFMKKVDCEKACNVEKDKSICSLPAETGVCDAYFPRFYFDKDTGECKNFVYGGCGGNDNNFRKEEDCQNACVCGKNQRYNECGTDCPLTCDNYDNPPEVCNKMCNPGCHCITGYVKTNDGQCVKPEDCPAKAGDLIQYNCVDEPDTGMCDGNYPMWYYDAQSRTCKIFIYAGCEGNGNKFETEEDCLKRCKVRQHNCVDKPEIGLCDGYFPMWYFDAQSRTCKKFVYGGCEGNGNKYETEEECLKRCKA